MKEESVNTLLDALSEFLGAVIVNLVLYVLLFYAVYKTVFSLEDEKEVQKWTKYWIFYGLISFACSYFERGSLVKTILCGILLLKFNDNVILHASYDIILANILHYSSGYFLVILSDITYGIYRIFESIHWTVIRTCNISDEVGTESVKIYEQTKAVIMKRAKQTWEELFKRISRKLPSKKEGLIDHSVSADHDENYHRLNQTCKIEPVQMDEDSEFHRMSHTQVELRQRHYNVFSNITMGSFFQNNNITIL